MRSILDRSENVLKKSPFLRETESQIRSLPRPVLTFTDLVRGFGLKECPFGQFCHFFDIFWIWFQLKSQFVCKF